MTTLDRVQALYESYSIEYEFCELPVGVESVCIVTCHAIRWAYVNEKAAEDERAACEILLRALAVCLSLFPPVSLLRLEHDRIWKVWPILDGAELPPVAGCWLKQLWHKID